MPSDARRSKFNHYGRIRQFVREDSRSGPASPSIASIFVLPFRNDGTNQVDELLRSRITDAIIDGLALIDGVKVGPRKSGWVRRDEDEVRREVVKQFGSRYVAVRQSPLEPQRTGRDGHVSRHRG